jgi:predicted amidohydrolase
LNAQENMNVALIVPRLTADLETNLATIESMAGRAVSSGAKLLVLPEAVLTGLVNNDDPAHDLPLGQTIPGPATDRLGAFCARHGCWLALGILERQQTWLYDSAVLLTPDGTIGLRYRRNQPQWHGKKADPGVYRQGTDLPTTRTAFGTVAFLLCGDLFDDALVSRFRDLAVDWMLFPFARSFAHGEADQARWDAEELPEYARRVAMARTPAFMVNYLADDGLPDDHCFGGAFAVSAAGEVLARHPLGEEGMLMVDMNKASVNRVQAMRYPRA